MLTNEKIDTLQDILTYLSKNSIGNIENFISNQISSCCEKFNISPDNIKIELHKNHKYSIEIKLFDMTIKTTFLNTTKQ